MRKKKRNEIALFNEGQSTENDKQQHIIYKIIWIVKVFREGRKC